MRILELVIVCMRELTDSSSPACWKTRPARVGSRHPGKTNKLIVWSPLNHRFQMTTLIRLELVIAYMRNLTDSSSPACWKTRPARVGSRHPGKTKKLVVWSHLNHRSWTYRKISKNWAGLAVDLNRIHHTKHDQYVDLLPF